MVDHKMRVDGDYLESPHPINVNYNQITAMKKRAALTAAITFTLIALLAVFIFREPSDVKLVRGVKPLSTQYINTEYATRAETFVQRSYSLQMSYDQAVSEVNKELPPSWLRRKSYDIATFRSPNNESIDVRRARYVTGLKKANNWSISSDDLNAKYFILSVPASAVANVPDADGWITVDTLHILNRVESISTKIKHAITNYHEPKPQPFQLVSPVPKTNAITAALPIDGDTTSLTGKGQQVTFYP